MFSSGGDYFYFILQRLIPIYSYELPIAPGFYEYWGGWYTQRERVSISFLVISWLRKEKGKLKRLGKHSSRSFFFVGTSRDVFYYPYGNKQYPNACR